MKVCAALAAILWSTAAFAQIRSEDECLRAYPTLTSPVEYATCMYDSEEAERSMAAAFARLMPRVSANARALLENAQSSWIANRNAQCAYEADGIPGSTMSSTAIIACTANENRAREKYLKDELDRWPIEK